MLQKRAKVKCKVGTIPFPKRRETSAELQDMDDRLRELREKIENGVEAVSVARSAALLYVDFLARIHSFSAQFDLALGYQLFSPNWTLEENVKRGHAAMRVYARLTGMLDEVITGLFRCLGGQEVITLQAVAHLVAEHPEVGTTISALDQEIQRIAGTIAKKSK
jgi:hypothetical protein